MNPTTHPPSQLVPTLQFEHAFWAQSLDHVAGIDEAGRGAWAGPVVAAAVVLPRVRHYREWQTQTPLRRLAHARDSKLLSPRQREALVEPIQTAAVGFAIGCATNEEIDTIGIVPATRLAMQRALQGLPVKPDALLIDALALALSLPQKAIVHGDQLSLSIACASILAKVARDHMLVELATQFPGYDFARHKGYGTAVHRAALKTLGVSQAHRLSFAPIKNLANDSGSSQG